MTKESLAAIETYLTSVLKDDNKSDKLKMQAAQLLAQLPSVADLEWTV